MDVRTSNCAVYLRTSTSHNIFNWGARIGQFLNIIFIIFFLLFYYLLQKKNFCKRFLSLSIQCRQNIKLLIQILFKLPIQIIRFPLWGRANTRNVSRSRPIDFLYFDLYLHFDYAAHYVYFTNFSILLTFLSNTYSKLEKDKNKI